METAEGDRRRELDLGFESELLEGIVDVFHGGYEESGRVVRVDEDLVPDGNGFDLGGGEVLGDVGAEPRVGVGLVGGCGGEVLVGERDDDVYARVGERGEDGRVGVVELDSVDALGFEQRNDVAWGWEVVGDPAVVYAYRPTLCNDNNEL